MAASGRLRRSLERRKEAIARDLLAHPFELADGPLPPGPDVRTWELDGAPFSARVVRRPP